MRALPRQGSAVLATRIYDDEHLGNDSKACKNQTCSLVFVAGGCTTCDDSTNGEQFHATLGTLEAYKLQSTHILIVTSCVFHNTKRPTGWAGTTR